jgi:gliding motility-associated-like protein
LLTEWSDSLSVEFCLEESGTYQVEQSIWFLGCEYTESHELVVVKPQGFLESENDYLCEEPPYILSLPPGFEYNNIEWSTAETSAAIEIYTSGVYSVTATDDYCAIEDTIILNFLSDSLSSPYLTLPDDTILCNQSFPFTLRPQSDYSDLFAQVNEGNLDSIILLSTAGQQEVYVEIENCLFREEINIVSIDCQVVYLPNVFSPNDDGLNDVFRPEGIYFQSENLRIYDRWGNLVFLEKGEDIEWNGETNEQRLGTANFVYVFEYLNLLTNEKEVISGDLLLLR